MGEKRPEIAVQVCYALADKQILLVVRVPEGSSLRQAVEHSGLLRQIPEIDLSACKVGIFGKLKSLDTVVRAHDRIEIYRPLLADPKEARRRRALKKDSRKADAQ